MSRRTLARVAVVALGLLCGLTAAALERHAPTGGIAVVAMLVGFVAGVLWAAFAAADALTRD